MHEGNKKIDWYNLCMSWERSDLSQKEYCKLKNIKYSAFKLHRYKYKLKKINKPSTRMLPVEVVSEEKTSFSNLKLKLPSEAIVTFSSDISTKELKSLLLELGLLQ